MQQALRADRRNGLISHPPVPQEHHPVGPGGVPYVVGHQHDRAARRAPLREQFHHRLSAERIERTGRLVGQQQRPAPDHGPGDRYPLLLATGQSVREAVGDSQQPDAFEYASGRRHGFPRPHSVEFERERHVLGGGQRTEQVQALEHEADLMPEHLGQAGRAHARQVAATDHDPARGGPIEAAGQVQQSRFARSARTHDRDELSWLDAERHVVERDYPHLPSAENLSGPVDVEDRHQLLRSGVGSGAGVLADVLAPAGRRRRAGSGALGR